jgi:hypothetical protein
MEKKNSDFDWEFHVLAASLALIRISVNIDFNGKFVH